ncbi:MAG: transcription antitermination factor NusB [Tenericutes bacterium]|nr:transcription antitermination factor NusB [Mycoplasmatota bacterium]
MKTRRESREIIMIALYQKYICDSNKIPYDIDNIIKSLIEEPNEFVSDSVHNIIEKTNIIDELINKYLNNWTIDRLGKTDQAILRLATYEILYTDTPGVVVIDEAIELSKQYSDDKVKNIINAVLDNILKNEVKN